ncbi:MAG TPA: L,D-transpeptidase family protein [Stellaceae bacterium]|nr:L,D-transpeptidase family protein [Stellaceae bacterium]
MRSFWLTARMRRGGATVRIAVAIVAAIAVPLWAGGALADDVTPPSDTALPITASPNSLPGDIDIKTRLDAPGALTIGGEPVHAALLRKFYAAHNNQPVWGSQQAQATALWHAVLNAGDQGLDPDLFHVVAFAKTALSPNERDMLLSDSFLGYADALARGAYPAEQRPDDQDLAPGAVDIVAALDAAIASPNPETAINALAPNTPAYEGLRRAYQSYLALVKAGGWPHVPETPTPDRFRLLQQRLSVEGFLRAGYATNVFDDETIQALKKFQERYGLEPADGKLGTATLVELNVPADARARQIAVNLERQRWLVRDMPGDRVWVNTASAFLELFRAGTASFTTRVVVGEPDKQTPEFQAQIVSLLYNPPWNIPYGIVQKEITPLIEADPDYLEKHHMTMRDNGSIQQEAGPYSALGRLKFEMPNKFDVYLHDTPLRSYFALANRRLSHGCVRVQSPRQLASLLMGISEDDITKAINLGTTNRRNLPEQIAVLIVYQTAFIDDAGTLEFRRDVYQRDAAIAQRLIHSPQVPVATRGLPNQRGS